ncbi:MAG TPA: DUF6345 domain-containing protein [Thermoanaerobaculia bacterium]
MARRCIILLFVCALVPLGAFAQITYSTGAVRDYIPNGCNGPDLPATLPEASLFRAWYNFAGYTNISQWANTDVWGSDFRDGAGNDLDPGGGSGLPQVYLFAGHGTCQNPPNASSPDFIVTCSSTGTPNSTNIGSSTRWGNDNLRFAFIDASCPMDLVSIVNQWGPVFQGLHVATGHSGTSTQDALDSPVRGDQLAARTAQLPIPLSWLIPSQSVGGAWMSVGTQDVQSGCCAVVVAAGATEADAITRRENERVYSGWSNPVPNWIAWRWLCRG